jgi:hypothetical protein
MPPNAGKNAVKNPFVDRSFDSTLFLARFRWVFWDDENLHRVGQTMGKRDDLIAKYADDLKSKCGITPDMELLKKVTIGCGPSIYDADASTVASSQEAELETVKNNFLIKKLGLADGPELMEAIDSVIETYGKSERNKYRAVVYYMLTKHFGKEAIYG